MDPHRLSRRAFLVSSAKLVNGSCLVLSLPIILSACEQARESSRNARAFKTFSADEARELEAIAARIIPSDQTHGAKEAGVICFMDHVLGDKREAELETICSGLAKLQTRSNERFSTTEFFRLDSAQQDQLLTEVESTVFFATLRNLTVAGMFALPEYGSNGTAMADDLIGFSPQHAWQAPYGFYNADYMARGE